MRFSISTRRSRRSGHLEDLEATLRRCPVCLRRRAFRGRRHETTDPRYENRRRRCRSRSRGAEEKDQKDPCDTVAPPATQGRDIEPQIAEIADPGLRIESSTAPVTIPAPMVGFSEVSGAARNADATVKGCPPAISAPRAESPPLMTTQAATRPQPRVVLCEKPNAKPLRISATRPHAKIRGQRLGGGTCSNSRHRRAGRRRPSPDSRRCPSCARPRRPPRPASRRTRGLAPQLCGHVAITLVDQGDEEVLPIMRQTRQRWSPGHRPP
jgi:hypothetical protein